MARHAITVDDLWALPRVGSPVPAPDGTFVVVPVTTCSMETNESTTRLWIVPTHGGSPRALTTAEASSGQPALSPDGKRLAFIRKPGGEKGNGKSKAGPKHPDKPQLYVLPLEGGEAERITDLPLGVADPRWFPDGSKIAFLAIVLSESPTVEATSALLDSREAEPAARPFVTEDRVYRYWDRWLTDGKVHHILAIDLATRQTIDLTPGSTRWFPLMDPMNHYEIAPDGREIAFTACRSNPPHDPLVFGVFTASVPARFAPEAAASGGGPSLLTTDQPGHAQQPAYSPDGRWIVYGMQREIDFYGDRQRLVAFDRRLGRHAVLTESWDRSCTGWSFGEDPATVFFTTETEGRMAILALDVEGAAADPGRHGPREIARGGSFADPRAAAGRIFTTLQSLREPPEVVSYASDGSDLRRLTSFTAPAMAEIDVGAVEEIVFEGAEGHPVQMFLVRPPESAPRGGGSTGKPPLVQVIHGGPHAVSGDQWHWRWNAQLFASPGYAVALVNFHGSTGWGQEYTASILGRWGDQPYRDVMAATDHLVARGLVDPERMAATGGSYGGYLAAWIASQTDRFACIVNHAGVSDFQTQYASDVTQGRRRAMGGEPWENVEGMDRYNPMRHAKGFRSPMLVIHGERDYRVPYDQGLSIYNIYRAMRLPARLVCYPDENHWILKPRNSKHWYGEVFAWLDRWMGKRPERA